MMRRDYKTTFKNGNLMMYAASTGQGEKCPIIMIMGGDDSAVQLDDATDFVNVVMHSCTNISSDVSECMLFVILLTGFTEQFVGSLNVGSFKYERHHIILPITATGIGVVDSMTSLLVYAMCFNFNNFFWPTLGMITFPLTNHKMLLSVCSDGTVGASKILFDVKPPLNKMPLSLARHILGCYGGSSGAVHFIGSVNASLVCAAVALGCDTVLPTSDLVQSYAAGVTRFNTDDTFCQKVRCKIVLPILSSMIPVLCKQVYCLGEYRIPHLFGFGNDLASVPNSPIGAVSVSNSAIMPEENLFKAD